MIRIPFGIDPTIWYAIFTSMDEATLRQTVACTAHQINVEGRRDARLDLVNVWALAQEVLTDLIVGEPDAAQAA